ncbi:MAG TPA: hypothetical protein VMM12_07110 [Longimicrobiales bacterium]|nr:hypothetical protein [Longimicrobiales bacterium]
MLSFIGDRNREDRSGMITGFTDPGFSNGPNIQSRVWTPEDIRGAQEEAAQDTISASRIGSAWPAGRRGPALWVGGITSPGG